MGGWAVPANASPDPLVVVPAGARPATIGYRIGAWFLDNILVGLLGLIPFIGVIVTGAVGLNQQALDQIDTSSAFPFDGVTAPLLNWNPGLLAVWAALYAAIHVAYFAGSWARSGATPCQRFLKIIVVDSSSSRNLTMSQALLRWFFLDGVAVIVSLILGFYFLDWVAKAPTNDWLSSWLQLLPGSFERVRRGVLLAVVVHNDMVGRVAHHGRQKRRAPWFPRPAGPIRGSEPAPGRGSMARIPAAWDLLARAGRIPAAWDLLARAGRIPAPARGLLPAPARIPAAGHNAALAAGPNAVTRDTRATPGSLRARLRWPRPTLQRNLRRLLRRADSSSRRDHPRRLRRSGPESTGIGQPGWPIDHDSQFGHVFDGVAEALTTRTGRRRGRSAG